MTNYNKKTMEFVWACVALVMLVIMEPMIRASLGSTAFAWIALVTIIRATVKIANVLIETLDRLEERVEA